MLQSNYVSTQGHKDGKRIHFFYDDGQGEVYHVLMSEGDFKVLSLGFLLKKLLTIYGIELIGKWILWILLTTAMAGQW